MILRVAFFLLAFWVSLVSGQSPALLEGQTFIHDPSTILRLNGTSHLFATGPGISTKASTNDIFWTNGPAVFSNAPAWTTNLVPGVRGYFWAPDVIKIGSQYFLYYSVSTFGKQISAIGLATSPTLDFSANNYSWTDRGVVIRSTNGSPFNAIDPSVMLDREGKLWMAFGSFWKGIYLAQLNPTNGLRLDPPGPIFQLAHYESIEAACLYAHGDYNYLFVNWGRCCRGTNSTYEIRVGRSREITGPYLDHEGVDLKEGGGTPFLATEGRFIGPGHVGILREGEGFSFSYHYYDGESDGRSRLGIAPMKWNAEGWPEARR
jgi:arabinan endo-1,5-alpha-L-arabinosidase